MDLRSHANRGGIDTPPHCDSMDGPVATAAARALDAVRVDLVLPFVPDWAEDEVRAAFARVMPLRQGDAAPPG